MCHISTSGFINYGISLAKYLTNLVKHPNKTSVPFPPKHLNQHIKKRMVEKPHVAQVTATPTCWFLSWADDSIIWVTEESITRTSCPQLNVPITHMGWVSNWHNLHSKDQNNASDNCRQYWRRSRRGELMLHSSKTTKLNRIFAALQMKHLQDVLEMLDTWWIKKLSRNHLWW